MRNILLSMVLCGFALAGCGGSGDDVYRPPGGGGGGGGSGSATQLTVVTSVPSIASDGSSTATITAFARDASNALIAGVPVTFTATSGGLSGASGNTAADGSATATLSTAGDPTVRTITVTATSGALTANVNVQVAAGGTTTTVSMGSGTGAQFQAGMLGVANPSLSAGGSTTLQAVLQQSDGTLYTQSASINFSSPCAAQGLASITNPVVTTSGIASATYSAMGCSGADVVTATATIGSSPVSATGTVTVAAGVIGSIVYVSAVPTNIALRGTGTTNHPETSTVIFRVLDQAGGPRVGTTVNFTLNTAVGGISVSPATAQSDANGNVQTVVQGGTVATTVRVTATVQNVTPVLATQSSQLTVTTGIPDQDSFSLAVTCSNVEAWSRDGVVVGVTARLSDRFNNPVPDGTAVTLQTEGGSIVSQCQTSGGNGACSVNWTSSNPRPGVPPIASAEMRRGRSTLLATAIGEESFTDTNGNGSFDNGEVFADMAERYLDENESNSRESFEPIYDFNNNSIYDAPDGAFNGVLCLDNTGRCSANVTTGISAKSLIIMSDGVPSNVSPAAGTPFGPIAAPGSLGVSIVYGDLNDNPMPAGTTISGTVAGPGISLGSPTQFTVPCASEPTAYPFTIIKAAGAGGGTLTVEVKTPSGLTSLVQYPIL